MRSITATVLLCVAFVTVVLGVFVYSVTREVVPTESELREMGVFVLPQPREIAPLQLVTADGRPFGLDDLLGRWSFLFFGFTHCPDICPTSLAVMAQAERQIDAQAPRAEASAPFQPVLVSVDPERDKGSILGEYVGAFSPTFIGVTGTRAQIGELARQLNVAFVKVPAPNGSYTVDHSGQIVIVNPRGHYHGFIKLPHSADTITTAFTALAAGF